MIAHDFLVCSIIAQRTTVSLVMFHFFLEILIFSSFSSPSFFCFAFMILKNDYDSAFVLYTYTHLQNVANIMDTEQYRRDVTE